MIFLCFIVWNFKLSGDLFHGETSICALKLLSNFVKIDKILFSKLKTNGLLCFGVICRLEMAQKGFIVKIFFFKDEEFLGQLVPE